MYKMSIVVPCYNEEESIPLYYEETAKVVDKMKEIEFEFIFIDDGSHDMTISELKKLADMDKRVKYISFSRNFGKEAAIYAGLENSTGDVVLVMDVDLQDPPEKIPEMYKIIKDDGYDCVATRRVTRKGEPIIRSFFANRFYDVINKISDTNILSGARDFRMMKRKVVDAIIKMTEHNRFSKGIFSWVGFKTKWLEYDNKERVAGKTKWSFWKLFIYALEGINSFSTAPLTFATIMGGLFCIISFVLLIAIITTVACSKVIDSMLVLITVISFIGGVQLFCIGILGQYVAKIHLESKKRPIYIMNETNID